MCVGWSDFQGRYHLKVLAPVRDRGHVCRPGGKASKSVGGDCVNAQLMPKAKLTCSMQMYSTATEARFMPRVV